jgi:hypothetical protein
MWSPPLYLTNPGFLNLFTKKLTRERVVGTFLYRTVAGLRRSSHEVGFRLRSLEKNDGLAEVRKSS